MNKDQTLLQEAYKKVQEPSKWDKWLSNLKHEVHEDGSISVDGNMYLSDRNLDRILFRFRKVTGDFSCSNNPNLTSLEGAPEKVGGYFSCSNNPNLTSLEGAPEKVGGDFYCNFNPNLTSLEGAPREVGESFYCNRNPKLKSLKGLPKARKHYTDFSDEEIKAELKRQYLEKFSSDAQDAFGDALWDL